MNHGFVRKKEKHIAELDANLLQFVHEKTGLELIWLKRSEENKTFGIAFTTIPENDTGVFHILEHSTLCGSEKYPVKEPFVELMKNSMNTFLNAMTFPDKTVYPVSSKNDKDFMNLVSVYLDAVFRPLIYKKQEIFMQEGWHFEFDEDGSVGLNGVVFNEMKGAYSDPDEIAETAINKALFPDTAYHYDYGGDPSKIPELTYEEFLKAHERFYSPSNAYVFLDGNVDIDAVFELLDEEYLSKYKKTERIEFSQLQKPVIAENIIKEYEVASPEEEEGTARLIFGNVIGTYSEYEKITAMKILAEYLCGSNYSPINKAVLEAGLAEDVLMSVQTECLQPYVKLEIRNFNEEDAANIENMIRSGLQKIVEDGIDKETLEAVIANEHFKAKERESDEYTEGVLLFLQVMESRLYGGEPEAWLEPDGIFEDLKQKAGSGYFEKLIEDVLIENPHRCRIVLKPSHTLGEEQGEAEIQRIADMLESLSESDIEKLTEKQEKLEEWQMSEDEPEKLAMMPCLKIEDIEKLPEKFLTEEKKIGDITLLRHETNHNGICYCSIYFDVCGLSSKQLSQLSFLCELFGKLKTKKYSEDKLINEVRKLFGTLEFSVENYAKENETNACSTKLCAAFSVLRGNFDKAIALLFELLLNTSFENTANIRAILCQRRIELYQEIMVSGSASALGRIAAGSTVCGAADEYCSGIEYYQFLKKLEQSGNFEFLADISKSVICRKNMVVSLAGDIPDFNTEIFEQLPNEVKKTNENMLAARGDFKEGIIIPADVAYAAAGGNITAVGGNFSGRLALAAHIISLEYLWNMVRVQGGAYGTGFSIRESGVCGCYSYRDPSAADSLEIFAESGKFLKKFAESQDDISGEIIGTIAEASPQLSTRMKSKKADMLYFKDISYESLCKRRHDILNATSKDLTEIADILENLFDKNESICVIGSKEQIEACTEIEDVVML